MEVVPWEEPDEDTSDCPTVIYDEGRPVLWLNFTPGELMRDPDWLWYGPDAATRYTVDAEPTVFDAAFFSRLFGGLASTEAKARERHPWSSTENFLRDAWLREHGLG